MNNCFVVAVGISLQRTETNLIFTKETAAMIVTEPLDRNCVTRMMMMMDDVNEVS